MSETAANIIQQDTLHVEALRTQELSTVEQANSYITEVVQGAKSASIAEEGRQKTDIPGVSFSREFYYPPSHDYQHDEVRIDYPNGSAAVASEFSGVTFISFYETDSDGNYSMRTGQSADFPGILGHKDTSHAQEKATTNYVELASEFKSRLEQRIDNPEESPIKNRLKSKLSGKAGRLMLRGAEVAFGTGVIIGVSEGISKIADAGDHLSIPVAVGVAASIAATRNKKK